MSETDHLALVRRPPSAVEEAAPGAKRILSGMVADALDLAKEAASKKAEVADADLESWCQKGERYYWGKGVPRSEPEAIKWLRTAAERGHARAQCWVAESYTWEPHGLLQPWVEAAKWYRKAADQGFAHGQEKLGGLYQLGFGVPQNDSEAVRWFRKAAEQGHPRAQLNLGECYSEGRGAARDCSEAFKWFKLAANNPATEAGQWFDLFDPRPLLDPRYAQLCREHAAAKLAALSPTMSAHELHEGERRYRELLSQATSNK